ncbi:uncharacterized protein [Physcomitrium patens]|uniref:Uncharacterized protein n=1 Tax=Physcomitrium patens TaxID=3218 RepID=A0A2K1KM56_PHYPA|nr:uncharacterized protein LOC112280923 [Physcomitrium patens]PNR54868.1 hypothetical protein PHYPA_005761 [Physcomitrium patens]|eukprot:XP_024372652.1 uncharacterized protein LOC112280923 [Physcomitrella patens]
MDRQHEPRALDFGKLNDMEAQEYDEEAALLDYISARQKQTIVESARWTGYSETHPIMQVLDIMRESTTILRKHSSILLVMGLIFAVPLSILLLSDVPLLFPVMDDFVRLMQLAAEQRFGQKSHRTGYRRLAEIVMSNVVDIPLSALFSPLLKAGVAYVVASTYIRKRVTLTEVLEIMQKIGVLLVQTFLWTCSVYLTFSSMFAALLWLASRISKASTIFTNASLLAVVFVGLTLVVGLAFVNVMCNLAYVVTILEGAHARQALVQSIRLLKGKFQVSLLLFLITNVNAALLDILFEFHIIQNADASLGHEKYWEAPLLVSMHSFVHLFDAIMVCVLYYICKGSEIESGGLHCVPDHHSRPNDLTEARSPVTVRSPFAVR